ncbi:MAG: hypothetical protein U0894_03430 [Pirellulales bacterium]
MQSPEKFRPKWTVPKATPLGCIDPNKNRQYENEAIFLTLRETDIPTLRMNSEAAYFAF